MLELRDFSAGYGPVRVVWGIDLKVADREIVTLIGPNGAGKTTTLKGVVGLADIFNGSILLDGVDVTGNPTERLAGMGVVFVPDERRLFPDMTVEENLELGAFLPRARRRVRDSLEMVYGVFPALRERRSQPARSLSGGEQQMLAIGRGLMARPKILLVDEPSTGLSPKLVASVLETFDAIRREGVTILFAEQNAYAALAFSDRAYLISEGRIRSVGESREILRSSELVKQYFGV